MRLLEMLMDRCGVFEALADSTVKLNRCTSAGELKMLSTQCLVAGVESRGTPGPGEPSPPLLHNHFRM
jgi:hypothetical protein